MAARVAGVDDDPPARARAVALLAAGVALARCAAQHGGGRRSTRGAPRRCVRPAVSASSCRGPATGDFLGGRPVSGMLGLRGVGGGAAGRGGAGRSEAAGVARARRARVRDAGRARLGAPRVPRRLDRVLPGGRRARQGSDRGLHLGACRWRAARCRLEPTATRGLELHGDASHCLASRWPWQSLRRLRLLAAQQPDADTAHRIADRRRLSSPARLAWSRSSSRRRPHARYARSSSSPTAQQVCKVVAPPFECDWDAGDRIDPHHIRASAVLRGGGRISSTVQTQGTRHLGRSGRRRRPGHGGRDRRRWPVRQGTEARATS